MGNGGTSGPGKELTVRERADGIRRLANRLGLSNPHIISDILLWKVLGHPALNPILLEKWLSHTGHAPREGESLRDCLTRHYGAEWADLAESLI